MSNLFKSGDIVCAKVNPTKPLKVRVFARKVYYCDVLIIQKKKKKFILKEKLNSIKMKTRYTLNSESNFAMLGNDLLNAVPYCE